MSNLEKAARQALDALEDLHEHHPSKCDGPIAALRAALAQQQAEPVVVPVDAVQAGPVAWMVYTIDGKSVFVTDNPADFTGQHKALPLYTSNPIYTMDGVNDE